MNDPLWENYEEFDEKVQAKMEEIIERNASKIKKQTSILDTSMSQSVVTNLHGAPLSNSII